MVVVARGGGSFEDLLPFSDERVVRALAACSVPVVSAVGHEQDTPLCDLAADARASTPTGAARLVVPDERELRAGLTRLRTALGRDTRRTLRARPAVAPDRRSAAHARAAPSCSSASGHGSTRLRAGSAPSRPGRRWSAATRSSGHEAGIVRAAQAAAPGTRIDVELAEGGLGARVEETHE